MDDKDLSLSEWIQYAFDHPVGKPHDACRESALHGLGHWQIYYHEATQLIDDFLRITPNLRVELVRYAESARRGHVN